jgi:hypothetical protein
MLHESVETARHGQHARTPDAVQSPRPLVEAAFGLVTLPL